ARRLGVDKMLTGNVTVVKGMIRVDTQVVDVSSGAIEGAFTRMGRRADFLTLESEVIAGALETVDLHLSDAERQRLPARRAPTPEAVKRLLEVEGEITPPPPSSVLPSAPGRGSSLWFGPRAAFADDDAIVRAAIVALLDRYRRATEAEDVAGIAAMYTQLP